VTAASGPLPDPSELLSVKFRLPPCGARSVKVWLHEVSADGRSEGLGGRVAVDGGGELQIAAGRSGQVIVPIDSADGGAVITVSGIGL
jgi:hypothetical protein